MSTLKQQFGGWLIPRLPVNPWVFRTLRTEANACWVRVANAILPGRRSRQRDLRHRTGLLVNIGCGPFGQDGWVNLDLFASPGVTLRVDCRRRLPLADRSARGIHIEHYLEHLEPTVERPRLLAECRRCLEPGGVLRVVVPDIRLYVEDYLADGWAGAGGRDGVLSESLFKTKAEALNHVFVQDGEHYGGFDAEYLRLTLEKAGFGDVRRVGWREGDFPGGPIDREQHRTYSLYMEARR
ncbi:class I SAM-dependent methyltransferase [Reyranella sp.]|uniref:class I SAM-dependent methyltransferase n=1 Tax=Reyranella sp. TaxID=1929291 RepID=UPI003BAB4FE1